eukprot:jgi/Botrbrau1/1751/Bobra.0217s0009.1
MAATGEFWLRPRPNLCHQGALVRGCSRRAFIAPHPSFGSVKKRSRVDSVTRGTRTFPESTFDILEKDLSYIQDHTGLDLLTPLAPVRDVHDKLVAVLNPIAGNRMAQQMEEQVAELQAELAKAKQEAKSSEKRLEETIVHLSALEATARVLDQGTASASESSTFRQYGPEPERSPEASTSGTAVAAPLGAPSLARKKGGKKRSELAIPEQLREFWFPAEFSSRLPAGQMVRLELFEEPWVLFRDSQGKACCIRDECAHRACPLSAGTVVEGCVRCPYHGWEYDGEGSCTKIPSVPFSQRQLDSIHVQALPVQEAEGFVWVWPGRQPPSPFLPESARVPSGFTMHAELVMEVPVEHGLLVENLLDLAHAPFTHTSTFARGWSIPDLVRFKDDGGKLKGHWDPYPIDMSFKGPCMVISTIGMANVGKIQRGTRSHECKKQMHQLHVCLPAGPRTTRLLYRMSMNYLQWAKGLSIMKMLWKAVAEQVLSEDLVLVVGQQDRMLRGADIWANPVPYDRLGVHYREWRNCLAANDFEERQAIEEEMNSTSPADIFNQGA